MHKQTWRRCSKDEATHQEAAIFDRRIFHDVPASCPLQHIQPLKLYAQNLLHVFCFLQLLTLTRDRASIFITIIHDCHVRLCPI